MLADDALRDRVVDRQRRVDAAGLDAMNVHALVAVEASDIRDERLDHEHAAGGEPRGHVAKACDLRALRCQAEDRAEHDVDQRELAFDRDAGEVAERHRDRRAAGLFAQPLEHRLRRVDAMHGDATRGQRDRDPAGPDPQLERWATCRELVQPVDRGRRIEVAVHVVVDSSPGLAVASGIGIRHPHAVARRAARPRSRPGFDDVYQPVKKTM